MVIDHICFAVKDVMEGVHYWKDVFGYTQMTKPVINTRQHVKVVFLKKENSIAIKLIEPVGDFTSLKNFVSQGGGFHHICFRCDDIHACVDELRSKNVKLLVPPQTGEAFNNNEIAFFMAKNNITFELIDTEDKADRI